MKRREFMQAAAVLPLAAALPFRLETFDWKTQMHSQITACLDRSEIIQKLRTADADLKLRRHDVLVSSDVRVLLAREHVEPLGVAPIFSVASQVIFQPGEELEKAENTANSICRPLSILHDALVKRGHAFLMPSFCALRASISKVEFYAFSSEESSNMEFARSRSFVRAIHPSRLPKGTRAACIICECRMIYGLIEDPETDAEWAAYRAKHSW